MPRRARKVAIVSPFFPPSTLAGVHRARLLSRHLGEQGWEPVVFCVHERFHEESLDPELARLVPEGTRVIKTGAIPQRLARRVGLGDISLRGYLWLRRSLFEFAERERPDAVLVTMSPYYPSFLAVEIKRRLHIPIVLDYQDPWLPATGGGEPWTKGWLSHQIGVRLEPHAIRWADAVTSVSDGINRGLQACYPKIPRSLFADIPIGGDPLDYEALRGRSAATVLGPPNQDEFRFCYVGGVWPQLVPTVEAFLASLLEVRSRRPDVYRRMRLFFIGTSARPDGHSSYRVRPIAVRLGVEDAVVEVPQRVGFVEALSVLASADSVMILGSPEAYYAASKFVPCALSGRPLLAFVYGESTISTVIAGSGGGRLVTYSAAESMEAKQAELASALIDIVDNPASVPAIPREAVRPYCADAIAQRFAEVLDRVASRGPQPPWW